MDFPRIAQEKNLCKLSKEIARYIVDEKGDILQSHVNKVLQAFSLDPKSPFHALYPFHLRYVLLFLLQKPSQIKLRQLCFPLANPFVETLIEGATKKDISVSFISALLTFLRQTVGSCFATAPIIFAQTNDIEFLFNDLFDLITRGFLKRVINGIEYKVPISIQSSFHQETESPLMKCYEYTVASLADRDLSFYKWSTQISLGLDPKEPHSVGEALFSFLSEKLDALNKEIQSLNEEAFHAEDRYLTSEALFKEASSEEKARRHALEAKAEAHHYFASKDLLEEKQAYAKIVANFYPFFIEKLFFFFPLYFQEVFDPSMQEGSELEDKTMGFRLLFKNGSSDPTKWRLIYEEKEYINALFEFFRFLKSDIGYTLEKQKERDLLHEVIDKTAHTLQKPSFQKNLYLRLQKASSYQTQRKILSPWAYLSGGNLESLANTYFQRKTPFRKVDFHPSSPKDLCLALIEYMKDLPYTESKPFEDDPLKAILMTSPIHAFLFKPGLKPFLRAWQDRGNTYTFLRDSNEPLPFGDTNWNLDLFTFAKHEGEIQLYRQTTNGLVPLSSAWDHCFSKGATWSLYI